MKPSELHIGQKVVEVSPITGRKSIPMVVTGIFTTLHDLDNGTAYLDFEGNEADVWEADVKDLIAL